MANSPPTRAWPWLTAPREQICRGVVDACATLAHHAEPDEALTWLQHATAIDPYNEALHHQAADLLEAYGDHVAAVQLIKNLHNRFADTSRTPG